MNWQLIFSDNKIKKKKHKIKESLKNTYDVTDD